MKKEQIIQRCLELSRGSTYLEVGVREGDSVKAVCAKTKWGVDPFIKLSSNPFKNTVKKFLAPVLYGINFFEVPSDSFFEQQTMLLKKKGLDVVLVDGMHTYEQSLRDVQNSLKYLRPNGFIVMHDCSPATAAIGCPASSESEAISKKVPGLTGEWCGDVWKTIVYLRAREPDLKVCVIDCDYGVGIIKRGKAQTLLRFSEEEIDAMTFQDLDRNRKELLDLKKTDELERFLSS